MDGQTNGGHGQAQANDQANPAADLIERLTTAMERMGERGPRVFFKTPKFDGTRGLEYFLDRLLEVAEAND